MGSPIKGPLGKETKYSPLRKNRPFSLMGTKSCTTGKAGGLKESEPLKAVENQEPPKGDC